MIKHKPNGQHERILKYLRSGKRLTLINCYKEVGVMALSQRIGELVREGYPIIRTYTYTLGGSRIGMYYWKTKRKIK
jgi:hypothetical protein